MIESFVDLTYHGVELARRVKLTAVSSSDGYLEVATPMPIGTQIAITTDERLCFGASVSEIHEQIAGATQAPGMRVIPNLHDAATRSWWDARSSAAGPAVVVAAEITPPAIETPATAPDIASASPVNVQATKASPRRSAEILAQVEAESMTAAHEIVDDGRRTIAMDAVDPALIEQLLNGGAVAPNDDIPEVDPSPASGQSNATKKKTKRGKAR